MDSLLHDLSYAFRSLRRAPGYTAAVVATLAIGIGPLTAVFCVVHSVLVKPLPFEESDRLVQIWTGSNEQPHGPTASSNFVDLGTMSHSFASISAEDFGWFNLTGDAPRPERLFGAVVSGSFFSTVGMRPMFGRALTEDDERAGAHVAVISNGLWRQRYGGEARVIGRDVSMNGEAYRIVGIMPPGFDFPSTLIADHVDLWVPVHWTPETLSRGIRRLGITARLARGVTLAQAQADLNVVSSTLSSRFPSELTRMSMRLVPLQEELVGSSRRLLLVLSGAVAMILLIACANVSNLALARAQTRDREMQVRAALGAGRGRILRQLLTENLVLALAGGTLGLLAATWLTAAIGAAQPRGLPRVNDIGVDTSVFICALLASAGASILFGLAPAFEVNRGRFSDALSGSGRSSTDDRGRRRARGIVVSLEIGLAVMLLVGAGLLLRSLERLLSVNPGFDSRGVVTARATLPSARFGTEDSQWRFVASGVDRLAALPGIKYAAAIDYLPFSNSDARLGISIDGQPSSPTGDGPSAHTRTATSSYFAAMRIPVMRGRSFATTDRSGTPLVAIVNEAMARAYWPNEDPAGVIGHRVAIGTRPAADEWRMIVGVVGDVKHRTLGDAPEPVLYLSMAQAPTQRVNFVVRGERATPAIVGPVRDALLALDRQQPVTVRPLDELVGASMAEARFRGTIVGGFALIALVLAVVGVYGVISFAVSRRTREIGVRIALGARGGEIVELILREGMLLTVAGLTIGFVASIFVTRTLQGMLFEVGPTDAVTLTGVGALLLVTATIANYFPASRAAKVDPMIAMRAE